MAKRLGSPYLPGRRTPDWRKIKLRNTQDCVIVGWTPGQGGRSDSFGALLVGVIDDGDVALDRPGRQRLHRPHPGAPIAGPSSPTS